MSVKKPHPLRLNLEELTKKKEWIRDPKWNGFGINENYTSTEISQEGEEGEEGGGEKVESLRKIISI